MKRRTHRICVAATLAALACVPASALRAEPPPCPAGTDRLAEYRLFFGRSQGEVEVVNDAAWHAFLADEITPRFPDGLTVLDAAGQWRHTSGRIVRERSKLVIILAESGTATMQRTDEITRAYQRTFGQESVLRVITAACASF